MATKGKYGKIIFSDEEITFIKNNFHSMTNDAIAAALGLKKTRVRTLAYEMGLKRMELEYWTPNQVAFLKQNYQSMGDVMIAEFFENEWPKNKPWTKQHIEKKRRYLKLKRTSIELQQVHLLNKSTGRLTVANRRRWETTGSNAVGTIVLWNCNGYKIAQIKTENGYVHYNRWLWEQHHGAIPAGYNIVKKEGCPEIATIEFLEMITKGENAIRNKNRYTELPQDLKEIISIKNKINKHIKQNDNRNNQ
jgi:hypothetical protein